MLAWTVGGAVVGGVAGKYLGRPFPYDQVNEIIVAELGAPPEELFATFDREPPAAASLAQVHRATLKSGEQVVVKVQRPNIQKQVKADVGIMDWLASLAAGRFSWARDIDLVGMVDEFGSQVLLELDYKIEAWQQVMQELLSLEEATRSWLEQYKKGRFEVYLDTSGFGAPLGQLERLARYIILGILLAGIIVGSAIATGIAAAFDMARSEQTGRY